MTDDTKIQTPGNVTPVIPHWRREIKPVESSQLEVNISVTDLYTIGIGPSSSHTVGPMRAAKRFADFLTSQNLLEGTYRVIVELYGSLALTGHGHGTDIAIMLGLSGERPSKVVPESMPLTLENIRLQKRINLAGLKLVEFHEEEHLLFLKDKMLPEHSNGMRFYAYDADGGQIAVKDYFSVGGGYVVTQDEGDRSETKGHNITLPHLFTSADELLAIGKETGLINKQQQSTKLGLKGGKLKFEYGSKTIKFAGGIQQGDAIRILDKFKSSGKFSRENFGGDW